MSNTQTNAQENTKSSAEDAIKASNSSDASKTQKQPQTNAQEKKIGTLKLVEKGKMEGPNAKSTEHGEVMAVCVSAKTGTRKDVVDGAVEIIENYGIKGDAHAVSGGVALCDTPEQPDVNTPELNATTEDGTSSKKRTPNTTHRQVSLLAWESIEKARARGLDVNEGDFAENITTRGINLMALPLGTQLKIGDDVLLELSQQGKVCHKRCAIYYLAGDCIFPREGIFFVVLHGGQVRAGDSIDVVKLGDGTCKFTPKDALEELENTPR